MKFFLFGALIVCAALAIACAPAQPAPPTASPAKLTDGKIVLAVINDQSGPYADLSGRSGVEAVKMAADDYVAKYGANALGGPIEVITADHQNKGDLAASRAQEFYDQKQADVIIDVPSSAAALAIAQVANEKKKLHINITAATNDLTGANCSKYTFHYAYNTFMLASGTGTWVTKNLGKKWYIIYPNYAFGQDMNKSFMAAIQASGGTVIASDPSPWPNDAGDFTALLQKAQSAKPEILGVMNAGSDLVNLVRQYNVLRLRDQGITLAIGLLFDSDIRALGPEAYAGVVYTTPWLWTMDEQTRAFADRFQKRADQRPTFAVAGDYSAAWQYLDGVRRAGTDESDAVVKQLEGYKFSDMFIRNGYVRPEDHWVVHDALLAQVKSKSEVKEAGDFSKILNALPGAQVSRPLGEGGCSLPK